MKKIEKVSIANISFTLDDDAYASLQQYLNSLHYYYDDDPDGPEIIADIEARIAELILTEQVYTKLVPKSLIDIIVAQLGSPEQIDNEAGEDGFGGSENGSGSDSDLGSGLEHSGSGSDSDSDSEHSGSGSGHSGRSGRSRHSRGAGAKGSGGSRVSGGGKIHGTGTPEIPRRLHRSAERRVIGGVCVGMANYFDVDVIWFRLAFLFPMICRILIAPFDGNFECFLEDFFEGWSWVFFVTYIVLWIALPVARTARQKLESRGERITPSSIRQNLQDASSTPSGKKAASVAAEIFAVLGRIVLFFIKFVAAIIGFSLVFASLGVLLGMIFYAVDPGLSYDVSLSGVMNIVSPVWFAELMLFCVMVPLFIAGMALLAAAFGWRLGRVFFGLTLGLWACAMIFTGIVAISNAGNFGRINSVQFPFFNWRWHGIDDDHYGNDDDDDRDDDGERWRSEPGRRKIREIRDAFDGGGEVQGTGVDTLGGAPDGGISGGEASAPATGSDSGSGSNLNSGSGSGKATDGKVEKIKIIDVNVDISDDKKD